MNKLLYILIFAICSCQNRQTNKSEKWIAYKADTLVFKKWFNDTLQRLKSQIDSKNVILNISKDTTFFEIIKKYRFSLADSTSCENDIKRSFYLLRRDSINLNGIKTIEFITSHQFSISQIHLKYDYSLEILNFTLFKDFEKVKLNYVKGIFIDLKEERD